MSCVLVSSSDWRATSAKATRPAISTTDWMNDRRVIRAPGAASSRPPRGTILVAFGLYPVVSMPARLLRIRVDRPLPCLGASRPGCSRPAAPFNPVPSVPLKAEVMRVPFKARVLAERLLGRSVFEASYYRESQYTRLMNLFAHVDVDRWKGMRMLEVGAGLGHLGEAFQQLGFEVKSTDGRPEHVKAMKSRGLDASVLDLNAATVDDFRGSTWSSPSGCCITSISRITSFDPAVRHHQSCCWSRRSVTTPSR